MRKVPVVAAAIGFVALVSCSTLKLKAGWDQHADFSRYHTWMWKDDGSIKDPVWSKRFQSVLADELSKKKLEPVEANPDLWVVVHARLSSETQVVSYSPAWGYGWGAWAAASETVVYQIPVGTIVIDLVDTGKKELMWRGTASDAIRLNVSNEQREERLIEILAQLFAQYPAVHP